LYEKKTIVNAIATLYALAGTSAALNPKSQYASYGIKEAKGKEKAKENEFLKVVVKSIGVCSVGAAMMSKFMLQDGDATKAIGYGYLPWALFNLKNIADKSCTKAGIPGWTQLVSLAIQGFFSWAMITGRSFAPNLAKFAGIFTSLNALYAALSPKKFAKDSWGQKDLSPVNEAEFKLFGYNFLGFGAMAMSLARGDDINTALAYQNIAIVLGVFDGLYLSKTFEKAGMKTKALIPWMLLPAVIAGSLLK
jgi:hypothetical protein